MFIIGEGELEDKYLTLIKKKSLEENITLIKYHNNVFNFMNNCLALISTSLWEDPGFVMIEGAASNALLYQ